MKQENGQGGSGGGKGGGEKGGNGGIKEAGKTGEIKKRRNKLGSCMRCAENCDIQNFHLNHDARFCCGTLIGRADKRHWRYKYREWTPSAN